MNQTLKTYRHGDDYVKVVDHWPETKHRTPRRLIMTKKMMGKGMRQIRSFHDYSPELLRWLYKEMISD